MNLKSGKEKEQEKRLYVCLDRGSGQIFYASMVSRDGSQAEMRSSWEIEKGMSILMRPVPENWGGQSFGVGDIKDHPESMEASISRTEGRGAFFIRILTFDELDIVNRMRTGQLREDALKITVSVAGLVATIKMEGGVGIESAAKIQGVLREFPTTRQLILLDMSRLAHFGTGGVAMLYMVLKEAAAEGRVINILVKPGSRIEEILSKSKIETIAAVFDNRESAVTALLKSTLE